MAILNILLTILVTINTVVTFFVIIKLNSMEGRLFNIISNHYKFNDVMAKSLDDIKYILMKVNNINEMPRPGKYQTKIKPTLHTNSELYDKENET